MAVKVRVHVDNVINTYTFSRVPTVGESVYLPEWGELVVKHVTHYSLAEYEAAQRQVPVAKVDVQ